jgi:tRNA(Ile)-lysidine synthase
MIHSLLRSLCPPARSYLVGVSGGRDSVVLLDLLHREGYKKLTLCHLNHRLRGNASAADARFVARLGDQYGYSVETATVDVRALAKAHKESIETAARNARWKFFANVSARTRCNRILLAHHADDQVETVLMSLFRGAGLSGLGGMSTTSIQQIGRRKLEIIRPMLGIWREEIDAFAEAHKLQHREDASNASGEYLRNRVRHELLPKIQEVFHKDVRSGIERLSKIVSADNDWLTKVTADLDVAKGEQQLDVKKLRTLPVAAQRRVLQNWLQQQKIPDAGFEEIERIRTLIPIGAKVAKVNLPTNKHARRQSGIIFIE